MVMDSVLTGRRIRSVAASKSLHGLPSIVTELIFLPSGARTTNHAVW